MLQQDQAAERIHGIEDRLALRLTEVAWSAMFSRFMAQRDLPASDFDADFFVAVLEEAFSDQRTMQQVLRGDPEDDW